MIKPNPAPCTVKVPRWSVKSLWICNAVWGLLIGLQKERPLNGPMIDGMVAHFRASILARVAQPHQVLFWPRARSGHEFAGCRTDALGEVPVGVGVTAASDVR